MLNTTKHKLTPLEKVIDEVNGKPFKQADSGLKPPAANTVRGQNSLTGLTDEHKSIISQALWDMNLTPDEFLDIIEGRSDRKWPGRGFCVARMLESVNWFKIVKVIDPRVLCGLWPDAKRYVRFKEIKEGMDFACRILQ